MPATTSRRTTPARKKAKLDHADVHSETEDSNLDTTPSHKSGRRAMPLATSSELTEPVEQPAASDAASETPAPAAKASSRPTRSAKGKAREKLAQAAAELRLELQDQEPTSWSVSEAASEHDQGATSAEAPATTSAPSRDRDTRAVRFSNFKGAVVTIDESTPPVSETDTPTAPSSSIQTSTRAASRPQRSTKAKAKASFEQEQDDQDYQEASGSYSADEVDTPTSPPEFKTPVRAPAKTPRSAKGKRKAKLEDNDYDDAEELVYGKDPDVEVFTQQGPLSSLNRIHMKTQKPRSLRPLWIQGVYNPPFFGVPTTDIASSVANTDRASQPKEIRDRRAADAALPWPQDGHAKTWLDPDAYPRIKTALIKHWNGQVGWVPKQGLYDWGWYPGKAFGWKKNLERSEWVQNARQLLSQGEHLRDELMSQADRAGWPFVQPWLDTTREHIRILTNDEIQPYLHDTTTSQRCDLRHPTAVMKLTVPELTMRNRLRKSIITDTPQSAKKGRTKAGIGGADADTDADQAGAEEDDEGADEDDNAIAAVDAKHEPINPDDPKFANIPNLGFEEKGPIYGEVLHISVGSTDQETRVQIPKGASKRLDSLGVVPDEGHLLNVGGYVYDLDWVPVPIHLNTGKEFFVVSAATSKAPLTVIGQKQQRPVPASLQLWSVSPDSINEKGNAQLEMLICHDLGVAFKLAFCPIGHDFCSETQRLGILAGCFADGSLSLFCIPHPKIFASQCSSNSPPKIYLSPILSLKHSTQSATSLCWAGGELVAFGGSHGWLGVWNVGRILRRNSAPDLSCISCEPPDYVVRAHRSAITDVTFINLPLIDSNGIARTNWLPTTLFSVSLDGLTNYVDLKRGGFGTSTSIERSRTVHYACTFSSFSGGSLVHEHADGSVAHYSLRPEEMLRSRQITHTASRVVSLSCSNFHPMLAMGTAHGQVKLANVLRTLRRSQRNHLGIYELILDRSQGEMVMKRHLNPEIANHADDKVWHIGMWHPTLKVTTVKWCPNLGRCRLLLSATAFGLVSVDFVKPPYED